MLLRSMKFKIKTRAMKQEVKTVTEYANVLPTSWQELDYYRVFKMNCTADATILRRIFPLRNVLSLRSDKATSSGK